MGIGAPLGSGGRRKMAVGLAAVIAVVVIAVVLGVVLGGGSSTSLAAGGCVANTLPAQGRQHISASEPFKNFKYNSFPPTSGPHQPTPTAPAVWNFYEDQIKQTILIHNLEHGGVVVQYGDQVPAATVDQIRSWWASAPDGLVVAPLPALGDKVALTAWTQLLTCPGFSEKAFDGFKDRYLGKGPERFPVESLRPGAQ